ncbi:MAG: hypothetical protein GAK45_00297 [Pseudomonas citronellolis]|nr:MAG: hypothetical protein GAK45_00297 [Pseudomonas citronellolis]
MNAPLALRRAPGEAALLIDWGEAAPQRIAFTRLRGQCPCSQCRAARLHGRLALAQADVGISAIHPQGYGVQVVFDDGHDRGIYPWAYLRALG